MMTRLSTAIMLAGVLFAPVAHGQAEALPNDPAALTEMADRAFTGIGGAADDDVAFDLYRRAAELGHPPAQFRLGYMYAAGRGVSASDAMAADWYRRAVAQTYPQAMTNLGVMYYEGRGVARDVRVALDLLNRAAEAGDKRARDYLIETGQRR